MNDDTLNTPMESVSDTQDSYRDTLSIDDDVVEVVITVRDKKGTSTTTMRALKHDIEAHTEIYEPRLISNELTRVKFLNVKFVQFTVKNPIRDENGVYARIVRSDND